MTVSPTVLLVLGVGWCWWRRWAYVHRGADCSSGLVGEFFFGGGEQPRR